MKTQKYLDSLVKDCVDRLNYVMKLRNENSDLFDLPPDVDNIDEETLEKVYKVSLVVNDSKTAYAKLASFLNFCNELDLEVDTSVIKDVKGISDFLEGYIPFQMNSSKVGDTYEVNTNDYKQSFDIFRKTYKTLKDVI